MMVEVAAVELLLGMLVRRSGTEARKVATASVGESLAASWNPNEMTAEKAVVCAEEIHPLPLPPPHAGIASSCRWKCDTMPGDHRTGCRKWFHDRACVVPVFAAVWFNKNVTFLRALLGPPGKFTNVCEHVRVCGAP